MGIESQETADVEIRNIDRAARRSFGLEQMEEQERRYREEQLHADPSVRANDLHPLGIRGGGDVVDQHKQEREKTQAIECRQVIAQAFPGNSGFWLHFHRQNKSWIAPSG
jgi:hypothetical protein